MFRAGLFLYTHSPEGSFFHMANMIERQVTVRCSPAAEGVRIEVGSATACAVRNRSRDITVRVFQESHTLRDLFSRIPLLRGVARLFNAFSGFFAGLSLSSELKPRAAIRGSAFSQEFARLFSTHPQTIAALIDALAVPLILAAMMLGLPGIVECALGNVPDLPRFAINAVCCLFRLLGAVLSVYMICRLKVFSRMCMYRGAAAKVINAYEAYGSGMTHESAVLSPRLTDKSDGAFLIVVMLVSIAAFSFVRTDGLLLQLCYRIGVILAAAAVTNEFILPLENADPNGALVSIRRPLTELQHLFTIEPHNQMIEVALCAFRAACENDLSEND